MYTEIIDGPKTERSSMKQRIVVQAVIKDNDKILLLHRVQGRPGIVGKYELPGGTLDDNEQPDDGLRRHLRNDVGIEHVTLQLADAMSMTNREEGDIQHIFIVYHVTDIDREYSLKLGISYDSYIWISMQEIHQYELRDSALYLLDIDSAQFTTIKSNERAIKRVVNKSSNTSRTTIYSDGGSRGNPGPSAAAFVIMNGHDEIVDQGGVYLGITTNNQAEYHGVRLGLEKALEYNIRSIECRVDSMLVVNQLKGLYKIKNRELWPINERITSLVAQFDKVTFTHVPRELNTFADSLVNKLLDEHKNDPR